MARPIYMSAFNHDVFLKVVSVVYHWKAIGLEISFAVLFFICAYMHSDPVAMVTDEKSIFCQNFDGFSPKNVNF